MLLKILTVIFVAATFLTSGCATTQTKINLSLNTTGEAVVTYQPPIGTSSLYFADNHPDTHAFVRSTLWNQKQNCARVEKDRITNLTSDCAEPSFTLSWDEITRDRRYPPLVRLKNGGVLVFTSYLAVQDAKGFADWELTAPPGSVVAFRGQRSREKINFSSRLFSTDNQAWAYLGPDHFADTPAANILVDRDVPPPLGDALTKLAPKLLELYRRLLDGEPSEKPTFFLLWDKREKPGNEVQADVASGNVIRFGLSGEGWAVPSESDISTFKRTVAHEIAHIWNTGVYQVRDQSSPWLHEGNAELLSVAALLASREVTAEATANRVNDSLTHCTALSAGRRWADVVPRNRGQFPYACGFALQLAMVAQAAKVDPSIDALSLWQQFWKNNPRYDTEALLGYLGTRAGKSAEAAMRSLLDETDASVSHALTSILNASGIAVANAEKLSPNATNTLAAALLNIALAQNCTGGHGFWKQPRSFDLVGLGSCKNFADGQKIRYLENKDLLKAPAEARVAAEVACSQSQSLRFKTLDGTEIKIPCEKKMSAQFGGLRMFELDTASIAGLLYRQTTDAAK